MLLSTKHKFQEFSAKISCLIPKRSQDRVVHQLDSFNAQHRYGLNKVIQLVNDEAGQC